MPEPAPPPFHACVACEAPLAADQRYCLVCGERRAGRPQDDVALLVGERPPAADAVPEPRAEGAGPAGFQLPGTRVCAALAVAVLGAGLALGGLVGPTDRSLADGGARRQIAIVAAPTSVAGAAAPVTTPTAPAAAPAVDPGSADLGTTDAAAVTPAAVAPAATDTGATAPASTDTTPSDTTATDTTPAPTAPAGLPPVKHVWVVSLAGRSYRSAFGATASSPYLAKELRDQGALLTRFDTVARSAPANGMALIGGQAPTPATEAGCPPPGAAACVAAAGVRTLPDQLTGAGLTWKAYAEDKPVDCSTPAPRLPFLFFHALVDDPACASAIAGLDQLAPDLAAPEATPAFSYVIPGACHDGSETPCTPGAPAGLPAAEATLRDIVTGIQATKAYKADGLIVVFFDGGPPAEEDPRPAQTTGALLLSPFVTPGATIEQHYDPASLLRSIEDLLGLEHLGTAGDDARRGFGPKVFAAYHAPATARTARSAQTSITERSPARHRPVTTRRGARTSMPRRKHRATVAGAGTHQPTRRSP
jgi:hypothetical protein